MLFILALTVYGEAVIPLRNGLLQQNQDNESDDEMEKVIMRDMQKVIEDADYSDQQRALPGDALTGNRNKKIEELVSLCSGLDETHLEDLLQTMRNFGGLYGFNDLRKSIERDYQPINNRNLEMKQAGNAGLDNICKEVFAVMFEVDQLKKVAPTTRNKQLIEAIDESIKKFNDKDLCAPCLNVWQRSKLSCSQYVKPDENGWEVIRNSEYGKQIFDTMQLMGERLPPRVKFAKICNQAIAIKNRMENFQQGGSSAVPGISKFLEEWNKIPCWKMRGSRELSEEGEDVPKRDI